MANPNEYEVMVQGDYTEDDGAKGFVESVDGMPQTLPCPDCGGTAVWAEAGYVPGTRACTCGSMFNYYKGEKTNEMREMPNARVPVVKWWWRRQRFYSS